MTNGYKNSNRLIRRDKLEKKKKTHDKRYKNWSYNIGLVVGIKIIKGWEIREIKILIFTQ